MSNAAECNNRRMEMTVGLFAILVFSGLFIFTVIVSRDSVFANKHTLIVEFEDIMGLRKGESVIIRGLEVGRVTQLDLSGEKVVVTALLDQPLQLHKGYKVSVAITSVLGGRHMLIEDGDGASILANGELHLIGAPATDLMAEATHIVHRIRTALDEGDVLQNVERVSKNLADITEKMNAGEGTAGKLINNSDLHDNLLALSKDLRSVSARLENGDGLLGKLLSEDDEMYDDLAGAIKSIREITDKVNTGEGTVARLVNDDELYDSLTETVTSLNSIAQKIEKGEGSLGKFVNDEALYVEAKEVMTEVRAAVDDFRETAPVVTFTSILFGAF